MSPLERCDQIMHLIDEVLAPVNSELGGADHEKESEA